MIKNKNLIPEGESCSRENGLCPYWKPIAYSGEDVIRAGCTYLDYKEKVDYQCTFPDFRQTQP